jgi:hypothetical protein
MSLDQQHLYHEGNSALYRGRFPNMAEYQVGLRTVQLIPVHCRALELYTRGWGQGYVLCPVDF